MKNTVHRHEPPVIGRPLEVLVDDGEVLVVDKPASIPVHPCGRFRHNTVIFILGKERGISELHTVHRLDRLTSGVLLFARTLETSKKLDQLVRDRQVCSGWSGFKLQLGLDNSGSKSRDFCDAFLTLSLNIMHQKCVRKS